MKKNNSTNSDSNIKKTWSPTQLILMGFFLAVAVGTLLLLLPFSTVKGYHLSVVDALFTATTSVCVTGLTTVCVAETFSVFGQVIILILIQCGGLGIIAFTTGILALLHAKITLRDRMLLEEAFNLNSLTGFTDFIRKIFAGTLIVEAVGAGLAAITLVPMYGPIGIWYSVFHSVSAFCNAGIDLMGSESLMHLRYDLPFNIVTMLLIILGGLGFPVWWDLLKGIRYMFRERRGPINMWHRFTLQTKIVLWFTTILILVGAAGILFLEFDNPATLGEETLPHKILLSMFQSVTLRTAGFYTMPQDGLSDAGAFFSFVFMIIGGSPIGTAGGIKTTTAAVLTLTVICLVRGRHETYIFKRKISEETIRKALSIVAISIIAIAVAVLAMLVCVDADLVDVLFEVVSATATVGLSRNLTGSLPTIAKLIVVILMYLGRTGPISIVIALGRRKQKGMYSYPEEEFPIG